MESELISCCGSDCATCYCYGEMCKGCNTVSGIKLAGCAYEVYNADMSVDVYYGVAD